MIVWDVSLPLSNWDPASSSPRWVNCPAARRRPALVDVHAIDDVEALLIPPENLRALMIAEPELGDRIMRALIQRRVALIETGAGGPVLIGPETNPDMVRLQGFLVRNGYPYQVLDPAHDCDAATLVERYAPDPKDLPLAVCPKGTILRNPTEGDLALSAWCPSMRRIEPMMLQS